MILNNLTFKNIPYTLYNLLDEDEYFIKQCNKTDKKIYTIEDFEYAIINLEEDEYEKFKSNDKDLIKNLFMFKKIVERNVYCKVYIDTLGHIIYAIKLKDKKFPMFKSWFLS